MVFASIDSTKRGSLGVDVQAVYGGPGGSQRRNEEISTYDGSGTGEKWSGKRGLGAKRRAVDRGLRVPTTGQKRQQ